MEAEPPITSTRTSDSGEGMESSLSYMELNCLSQPKVFRDNIHGNMELPYLCYKIINTPQFQRLRSLKQLGTCYYVYPSASHNRFEHSIGTCYLAGTYATILRTKQPELGIDDKDIICLQIAGLCHDIGHGPFSHLWEQFIHRFPSAKPFTHEELSIRMLDFLIDDNQLWEHFEVVGLDDRDLLFVKEAIYGKPIHGKKEFNGRDPCKYFLYQIVSNSETGIDVDKFDYLRRDANQLGLGIRFDGRRIMDNSRVIFEKEGHPRIAYRDKIQEDLQELFRERTILHKKAYQHPVTRIIEEMIIDGLVLAEPYFEVLGQDGSTYKLSTAHEDASAFMTLTDGLFNSILNSSQRRANEAASIFKRILRRDTYKYLGYLTENPLREDWMRLTADYPYLRLVPCEYCKTVYVNPLDSVRFFKKNSPEKICHGKIQPQPTIKSKYYILVANPSSVKVDNTLDQTEIKRAIEKWIAQTQNNAMELSGTD